MLRLTNRLFSISKQLTAPKLAHVCWQGGLVLLVGFLAPAANGDVLVSYLDGSSDDDAIVSTSSDASITVGATDNTADNSDAVRGEFGPAGGLTRYEGNAGHATALATTSGDDFLQFSITNTGSTSFALTTFDFSHGVGLNIGPLSTVGDGVPILNAGSAFGYSAFGSTDGGATFSLLDSLSLTTTAQLGELSEELLAASVDISGLGSLDAGGKLDLRLIQFVDDSAGNLGAGSAAGQIATVLQNVSVNAIAVPEPSSAALLAIAGIAVACRRRRG